MIHIVFNNADIAALEAAIELDESLAGKIIEIKDDYAEIGRASCRERVSSPV